MMYQNYLKLNISKGSSVDVSFEVCRVIRGDGLQCLAGYMHNL